MQVADVDRVAAQTATDLAFRLSELMDSPIEVSVANRKATIRGAVASEADRRRAEILATFEPGVSAVVNDLQLVDATEAQTTVPPEPIPNPTDPS